MNPAKKEYLKVGESKIVDGQVLYKPDCYDDGLAFGDIFKDEEAYENDWELVIEKIIIWEAHSPASQLTQNCMTSLPISNISWSPDCELETSSATTKSSFQKPISFDVEITKEMRTMFREETRTCPNLKYPRRKRAWRLIRKWFNRYQKTKMLGMTIVAESTTGKTIPMTVTDVKIQKVAGMRIYTLVILGFGLMKRL